MIGTISKADIAVLCIWDRRGSEENFNLNFEVRPMVFVNFVSLQLNPYRLLVTEFVAVQPKAWVGVAALEKGNTFELCITLIVMELRTGNLIDPCSCISEWLLIGVILALLTCSYMLFLLALICF